MSRHRFLSADEVAASEPDYVIVGGGPAGCVLAGRLTEDPGTRVLLLEAGRDCDAFRVRLPVGPALMLTRPGWDWGWETLPDPSMNGRNPTWSSGKMLGGSSSIHGQVHMRGLPYDFDLWAELLGDPGGAWSYRDLLPYFVRSEHYAAGRLPGRGVNGPLNVVDIAEPHPLAEAFIAAGVDRGFPRTDLNGAEPEGFGITQGTQKDGRRFNAYDGYVRPNLARPNLGVAVHQRVVRVVMEGTRAAGVEVLTPDGSRRTVRARREVILAAGTMGTTNLLLKSGIGPSEQLRRAGVAVALDAPRLGMNLQEHPGVSVSRFIRGAWSLNEAQVRPDLGLRYLYRLLARRDGPFAAPLIGAMGYDRVDPDSPVPELQLHFMPFAYRMQPDSKTPLTAELPKRAAAGMMATLTKPYARGTITIADPDPLTPPVIDHQLLGDERDLALMVAGLKSVTALFASPHFAPYVVAHCNPLVDPADDAGWEEYARRNSYNAYHVVGTCRMGRRDDPEAVVDPELKLIGADGLRVVDASVMPVVPSANTYAPTVAVAEKAADLVRAAS